MTKLGEIMRNFKEWLLNLDKKYKFSEKSKAIVTDTAKAVTGSTDSAIGVLKKFPQEVDFKKSMLEFVNSVGDVSKNITGKKFVEAAESLLDQQMRYNNILATRLAEALEDIEILKTRIIQLENKV